MHSRTRETKRERDGRTRHSTESANCFSSRPGPRPSPADGSKEGRRRRERDALFHFQHLFTSTLPSERKPDLHYIRLCTRPLSRKKTRRHFRPFYFHEFFFLDFVCYTLLILFAIHDELLLGFSIFF